MKARFVNESRTEMQPMLSKKYPMRKINLDPEIQEKYGIPGWALSWNGIDIPEAAMYVDDEFEVGDITENDVDGELVVVIYKDEDGTIATKAINL